MSYQLRPQQPSQNDARYDGYNTYENTHAQEYGYGQQPYVQPQQQQPDMTTQVQMQAPIPYHHEGLARTQTWLANQPPVLTPPPTTKTFSEWTGPTDSSTFDRRTLGAYSMPPRPPTQDARVCGIKRTAFLLVLAVGLFLLVVAIAVGLGVGLGTRKHGGDAVAGGETSGITGAISSSSSLSSTTTQDSTSTTPTSVRASPTPSFTGTAVPGPVICPQDNNTVYISQGTSKPFNVQCGRDYNSANGARDIANMQQSTMAQCIDACGERANCVGVGWGYYQGSYVCWMKSRLGDYNASPNWYFAQLQDIDDT